MSDNITWGDPIAVNGKRPAWLEDSRLPLGYQRDTGNWYGPDEDYPGYWTESDILYNRRGWSSVIAIRLPADHFIYTVLRWNAEHPDEQPFEPWGGGDAAPDDWDGGEVLVYRNAIVASERIHMAMWQRGWAHNEHRPVPNDIIGYRKRVNAQPVFDPAPHLATYDPATHVAVPLMTETEVIDGEFARYSDYGPLTAITRALDDLGVIRPDPTPLDRFKAAHPDWALRDREDLIADVIAWREGT